MRKSAITGDGAVPRSRNRSGAISSGSKSEHGSEIHVMNGCGDLLSHDNHAPWVTMALASPGQC
jgi:hypothetical protein